METMSLHVFSGLTGEHWARLPNASASWGDSINEPGSLNATVPDSDLDVPNLVRAWGSIVAVVAFGRVLHAGYVKHRKRSESGKAWTIEAGGGMSIFEKRLVINYRLNSTWRDGTVVVDEDHPSGNWPLTFTGSYSDLQSKLISESLKFGALPVVPAALTGGDKTRTYNSYDFKTVSDRIKDIGNLENGPEYRFDPSVDELGAISFAHVASADGGELVDNHWVWNAFVPESGVILEDEDADGSEMCTQSYGVGGKENDTLVVARAVSSSLTSQGWPILQNANTSHSSVSNVNTLRSYVRSDVITGDNPQRTIGLSVDIGRYAVHVGDWCDVRYGTGDGDVHLLKIVDVKGSTASRMATIQCRERV